MKKGRFPGAPQPTLAQHNLQTEPLNLHPRALLCAFLLRLFS